MPAATDTIASPLLIWPGRERYERVTGKMHSCPEGGHRRADRQLLRCLRALRAVRRGLPVLYGDRRSQVHADPQGRAAAPRLRAGIHAARAAEEDVRPVEGGDRCGARPVAET